MIMLLYQLKKYRQKVLATWLQPKRFGTAAGQLWAYARDD